MLISKRDNSYDIVIKFSGKNKKLIKKLKKLEKLFESQKVIKSGKKLSKNRN